jgi:hypothetical protein
MSYNKGTYVRESMSRKIENRNRENAGGGILSSLKSSPLTWFTGLVITSLLIATSVIITLDVRKSIRDIDIDPISEVEDVTDFGLKPNIVYILADDMGWNSLGYEDYDLSFATPTLTSLAKDGVILNSFYAQEVCTPARGSLLTGRYPLSIGMQYSMVQTAIPWGLNFDETTIADVLKANNYTTHMFGKWHLGHYSPRLLPTARGFDTFTGQISPWSIFI